MPCLQATRAALDARALQVMPPALAKKLIKGGRLLGSLQTPACWCVHACPLPLARLPPRCCGLLPCPAVHGMHSTHAELQTTRGFPRHSCTPEAERAVQGRWALPAWPSYACPPPHLFLQTCGRARCARAGCPGTLAACEWPRRPPSPRQRGGQVSALPSCGHLTLLHRKLLGVLLLPCCPHGRLPDSLTGAAIPAADFVVTCAPALRTVMLLCCCQTCPSTPVLPHLPPSCSRLCGQLRPGAVCCASQGGGQLAAAHQVARDALGSARCACQCRAAGGGGRCAAGSAWYVLVQWGGLQWTAIFARMHAQPLRDTLRLLSPTVPPQATAWEHWRPVAAAFPCGCVSPWPASM